jgi:hypothetical protein
MRCKLIMIKPAWPPRTIYMHRVRLNFTNYS